MPRIVSARDGLPARENGEYALRKLEWLDRYLPSALTVTKRKRGKRGYVDLFAGPGINVDGTREFESGALRALKAQGYGAEPATFTDAILVNIEQLEHDALATRVDRLCSAGECRIPRNRIRLELGDANDLIPDIVRRFHPLDYLLVFADITGPTDLPWSSVQELKAQGHESIDFYVLFPMEMALNRMMAYKQERQLQYEPQLTAFFGTDSWKRILAERLTDAQSPEFRRRIVGLYCDQLKTLWDDAGEMVDVKLRGDQGLYRMLFAASHEAAAKISGAIRRLVADQGQGHLFSS